MVQKHLDLVTKLKKNPIIAGVRNLKDIPVAVNSQIEVIFLLNIDINDIMDFKNVIKEFEAKGVMIFPHLDLLKGIAADKSGISFLKKEIGITGIISTHANLLQFAKKEGLVTIQRLFILDSESLGTGLKKVQGCTPDGIEILPAPVLPFIKNQIKLQHLPPIIAGGLIRTPEDAKKIFSSGAMAVSTSDKELWVKCSGSQLR
jgi:glycerol uptake operon antiterminator